MDQVDPRRNYFVLLLHVFWLFFFLTKSKHCAIFLHYLGIKLQSMSHSCIYLLPFQPYSPHQSARLCLHQLDDEVGLAQASLQSLLSAIRKMEQRHLHLPEELMWNYKRAISSKIKLLPVKFFRFAYSYLAERKPDQTFLQIPVVREQK